MKYAFILPCMLEASNFQWNLQLIKTEDPFLISVKDYMPDWADRQITHNELYNYEADHFG